MADCSGEKHCSHLESIDDSVCYQDSDNSEAINENSGRVFFHWDLGIHQYLDNVE